jgi:hypothetical protein
MTDRHLVEIFDDDVMISRRNEMTTMNMKRIRLILAIDAWMVRGAAVAAVAGVVGAALIMIALANAIETGAS